MENNRIIREKKTIEKMIRIYCRSKCNVDYICSDCSELLNYSLLRLDNCKFGIIKPVCGKCKIHCYKPSMREKIIKVMRFSGPRMLIYHPILSLKHIIDYLNKQARIYSI